MKRPAKRKMDYQSLDSSELVWIAQVDKDTEAINEIYARKIKVVEKIAANYCRRYTFVDIDDLSQSLMLSLHKIIHTYRAGNATDWDKYCYHRLFFAAKDILRQRDDLGICWPQRKMYPEWHHLGDESLDGFDPVDYRELSEDDIDMDRFRMEIDTWRSVFVVSRPRAKSSKGKPSWELAEDAVPAVAWCDGKFYGLPPAPVVKKKRSKPVCDIARWKIQRSKPVQMEMF